jgi:hypothetical protein
MNKHEEQTHLPEGRFHWMPVLRAGTFKDKNNQTVTIDQSALDKIVSATNLAKEPQLVVEHPKFDEVGFGTITQLKRVGDFLFALPEKVLEKFRKAVNDGKLPGRSVTLDKNTFALKNVSFLPPDMPPAVAGLGAYYFQMENGKCEPEAHAPSVQKMEDENSVDVLKMHLCLPGIESHFARLLFDSSEGADIETGNLEFAQNEISSTPLKIIQTIFRNIKNFLTGEKSPEIAEEILPEDYFNEFFTSSPAPEKEQTSETNTSFSSNQVNTMLNESNTEKINLNTIDLSDADPQLKKAIESLQSENKALSADLKNKNVELQSANEKVSASQKEKLIGEVIRFCETDAKKKIRPPEREKYISYLLLQTEKGVLEFSAPDPEGSDTKVQLSAYDFAKEIIMQLPDFISDVELATMGTAGIAGVDNAELLAQKALEYQAAEVKAGRIISASAAVAYIKGKMR